MEIFNACDHDFHSPEGVLLLQQKIKQFCDQNEIDSDEEFIFTEGQEYTTTLNLELEKLQSLLETQCEIDAL